MSSCLKTDFFEKISENYLLAAYFSSKRAISASGTKRIAFLPEKDSLLLLRVKEGRSVDQTTGSPLTPQKVDGSQREFAKQKSEIAFSGT